MNTILSFQNVELNYHSQNGETKALSDISFNVFDKEFIAIVGPSGCGKTTILSLVSGILKPSSGVITISSFGDSGPKMPQTSKNFFAKLFSKKQATQNNIGYMFQRDHLFEWRSIWQNVCLGLEIQNKLNEDSIKYVESLLQKYGLWDFRNKYPRQLSGGMRQRVALIRTLALCPQILLLDEPFSALDYQTRLNVCDDVHKIITTEQKTAILVTHDISEAISLADRIIILSERPAIVRKIIQVDLQEFGTPFHRRESPLFSTYFEKIWKELETKDAK